MDYIYSNKAAWEEAFEHRQPGWGDDNHILLANEKLPFFNRDVINELESIDFTGKAVAQFCCNNGRELLSLVKYGAAQGTGFDIAENIIGQARTTAQKAGISNCDFVICNILEIDSDYHESFDFIMFTIGAITWFRDLTPLFDKVSKCLKPKGLLLINDHHPFMNMLPTPDEDPFDAGNLNRITYPYFNKTPWLTNCGMSYMTREYESKTFTSFSHTMSDIVNSITDNGMAIKKLSEYDYDIGITDVYDNMGYPLSYILLAEKTGL